MLARRADPARRCGEIEEAGDLTDLAAARAGTSSAVLDAMSTALHRIAVIALGSVVPYTACTSVPADPGADIVQDATTRGFTPFNITVASGDTLVWHFPSPSPGNAIARRVASPTTGAYMVAPYTPAYVNELVGPMIKAPSGIFALGPAGHGMVEQDAPCAPPSVPLARKRVGTTTKYLCRSADPADDGRAMDSTWKNPNITGVFIRLQWKQLQPTRTTWNDDILVHEVDAAVANGKLFSVVIESGRDGQPPWLFDDVARGGAGLAALELIWNDEADATNPATCDDTALYADPTSLVYRELYKAALTHVADVLKQNSARYRALAYIKPSGANRATGENRLPTRCKPGCSICNNQVWARAGYQPSKLYAFYDDQIAHIAREFPGKSMSYMLIQAGFPIVGETGCYEDAGGATVCPPTVPPAQRSVPRATKQTETIIDAAVAAYPIGMFVVEHQGLDAAPGSVNHWVTDVGNTGKPTMFQTSAGGQVGTPAELGDTIQNLFDHSTASALEVYEERLWEADGPLGAAADPTRDITYWNTALHQRRRTAYSDLGDPAPETYSFTFRTAPVNGSAEIGYFDPRLPVPQSASCGDSLSPCVTVR